MCTSFELVHTSMLSLEPEMERYWPGICCYCSDDASLEKQDTIRTCLGHAELFVDVNPFDNNDPFRDPPSDLHSQEEIRQHEFIKISKIDQTTDSRNDDTFPKLDAKTVLG